MWSVSLSFQFSFSIKCTANNCSLCNQYSKSQLEKLRQHKHYYKREDGTYGNVLISVNKKAIRYEMQTWAEWGWAKLSFQNVTQKN